MALPWGTAQGLRGWPPRDPIYFKKKKLDESLGHRPPDSIKNISIRTDVVFW